MERVRAENTKSEISHQNNFGRASVQSWSLKAFIKEFENFISPEVVALILVDVLSELEVLHRNEFTFNGFYPENVFINEFGHVFLSPAVSLSKVEKSVDKWTTGSSPYSYDLYALATLFYPLVYPNNSSRSSSRIHPRLREIIIRSVSPDSHENYRSSWSMRADLLDFLASIGVSGKEFFLSRFVDNPQQYLNELESAITARQFFKIRAIVGHERQSRVSEELKYLLEIAPDSPQALYLTRIVKKQRYVIFNRFAYACAILIVLVLTVSTIMNRYGLPVLFSFSGKTNRPLTIEPLPTPSPGLADAIALSSAIEINSESAPARALASINPRQGRVLFKLDQDMAVVIDQPALSGRVYKGNDAVWLKPGQHTITVMHENFPPMIGQIKVQAGYLTTVSARVTYH